MTEETQPGADNPRRELENEIEHYLEEKERIREIVGRIGGVPRKTEMLLNILFIVLVALSFGAAMIVEGLKSIPIDVAVLLVSIKLIYVVTQNGKLNHSQFWMLSTIEWRLNEMAKEIRTIRRDLDKVESAG